LFKAIAPCTRMIRGGTMTMTAISLILPVYSLLANVILSS